MRRALSASESLHPGGQWTCDLRTPAHDTHYGNRNDERVAINIPYRDVYDEELTLALADSITFSLCAIESARRQDVFGRC
jgi:hypothetical protein